MTEKPNHLFLMFGHVGAGKTTVARWLAPEMKAVHLRADGIRFAMFEGDRPELYTPENKKLVNNGLCYAAKQILKAGVNVVYDANMTSGQYRQELRKLAERHGAATTVVWVQTPEEVAKERIETRAKTEGHVIFDPNIIENMRKVTDLPSDNERVIILKGLASEEEQKAAFFDQFSA